MFVVTEEATAAIRTAYEQDGELSAAVELRRLFPGITDNAKGRGTARGLSLGGTRRRRGTSKAAGPLPRST